MSKLLRQMTDHEAQKVLEKVETLAKAVMPVDTNYLIVMLSDSGRRTLFQTNVTLEDLIASCYELATHLEDVQKANRKKRR